MKNKKKVWKITSWIAFVLLAIGGLNWGLIGFFKFDLVDYLLGSIPWLQSIVYDLVGISAVIVVVHRFMKK